MNVCDIRMFIGCGRDKGLHYYTIIEEIKTKQKQSLLELLHHTHSEQNYQHLIVTPS